MELIGGLRDGSIRVLDLSAMQGIVTFPSYHAALAAIFIWAFRAMPKLTISGAGSAGLTIIATPLGGGHYATDVVAGLVLTIASIAVARRLVFIGIRPEYVGQQLADPVSASSDAHSGGRNSERCSAVS